MSRTISTYRDEDSSSLLAECTYPRQLEVVSDIPPPELTQNPPEHIGVAYCDANGFEVRNPVRGQLGISRSQYLFSVPPENRNEYPFNALYAQYDRVSGKGAEYEALTQAGGEPLGRRHLTFAHGGNELTLRIFHSVNSPSAANDVTGTAQRPTGLHHYILQDSKLAA